MVPGAEAALRKNLFLEVEREITQQREVLRESVAAGRSGRASNGVASIAQLGDSGGVGSRQHTPSRSAREASRFHLPLGTGTPGTPRSSQYGSRGAAQDLTRQEVLHQVDKSAVAECRFHAPPMRRARSAGPERPGSTLASSVSDRTGASYAGVCSSSRKHTDAKSRSTTPDYHIRYSGNMLGSSLRTNTDMATEEPPRSARLRATTPGGMQASQQGAPWERMDPLASMRHLSGQWKTKCGQKPEAMRLASAESQA